MSAAEEPIDLQDRNLMMPAICSDVTPSDSTLQPSSFARLAPAFNSHLALSAPSPDSRTHSSKKLHREISAVNAKASFAVNPYSL